MSFESLISFLIINIFFIAVNIFDYITFNVLALFQNQTSIGFICKIFMGK